MKQLTFYVHDGCVSQQAILLLAREIQQACPDWHIKTHPLLEHEATALGFHALPTIAINGRTVAAGTPNKDWLLNMMKDGGETTDA